MGTPFSTLIRTASHEQHTEAESTTFMSDLLGGALGVDAYARYTEQLWFVYGALEEAAEGLEGSAVAGPFIQAELFRVPAIERDLTHLRGPGGATAFPRCRPRRPTPPASPSAPGTGPGATSPITTPGTWGICPAARSFAPRPRRTGASPARVMACGSTCSTGFPTLPPSSGVIAFCSTGFVSMSSRSCASWPSASGRSPSTPPSSGLLARSSAAPPDQVRRTLPPTSIRPSGWGAVRIWEPLPCVMFRALRRCAVSRSAAAPVASSSSIPSFLPGNPRALTLPAAASSHAQA